MNLYSILRVVYPCVLQSFMVTCEYKLLLLFGNCSGQMFAYAYLAVCYTVPYRVSVNSGWYGFGGVWGWDRWLGFLSR